MADSSYGSLLLNSIILYGWTLYRLNRPPQRQTCFLPLLLLIGIFAAHTETSFHCKKLSIHSTVSLIYFNIIFFHKHFESSLLWGPWQSLLVLKDSSDCFKIWNISLRSNHMHSSKLKFCWTYARKKRQVILWNPLREGVTHNPLFRCQKSEWQLFFFFFYSSTTILTQRRHFRLTVSLYLSASVFVFSIASKVLCSLRNCCSASKELSESLRPLQ